MKKKLFKTLFAELKDNYYPDPDGEVNNKTNNKINDTKFSVAFAYIFYKKLYNKEPSNPELSNFWKDFKSEGIEITTFDQATAYRSPLLKTLKEDLFEYDFWILKDWETKINNNKEALIDEINQRLKSFDENYIYLVELLNKEPIYCNFLEDIKESIGHSNSKKDYVRDIDNFLVINFALIMDFLKESGIVVISSDKEVTEKRLIHESLLVPLQDDLSPRDLIQKKWETLNISSINKFSQSFAGDFKSDFEKFQNVLNKNLLILKGKEGSGKSFLALYLALGALQNDYSCKYISIDENSSLEKIENEIYNFLETFSDKKTFIVIDSITSLNINLKSKQILGKISNFIDDLTNKIPKNTNILFTINQNSFLFQKVFSENIISEFQIFSIEDLQTSTEWVSTIMEKIILENAGPDIKSNFSLYHFYLMRVLEINSLKLDMDRPKLNELLGEIAYRSLMGNTKINDYHDFNQKIIDFLYYNPICKADRRNMDIISFNHDIFKYILAGEYLLQKPYQSKHLWRKNSFKDDKWRVLFKYFSERLDRSNIDKFMENPLLIRGIIFHLRRLRDLAKAEEFIGYIIDNQQKENEKSYLIIENAKKYYSRYGDYKRCLETLSEITDPAFEPELNYEYIIQVTSCTLDLFLPVITIKLTNLYLEKNSINDDPRLYGNLSRAFLRSGDYINAEKYLMKKLKIHQNNINLSDENRDKVDLILVKAFEYKKTQSLYLYKEALELAEEVLSFYDKKEKQEEISYTGKRVFIYRNLSYFLPFLKQNTAEELIIRLLEIINLDISERAPQGIILTNLACYYYADSNLSEAISCINKAIDYLKTYQIELCFAWNLHYSITGEKDSKESALEHYKNFEQNVIFTQNWLEKNTDLDNREKVSLPFADFTAKKLNLLEFSIF